MAFRVCSVVVLLVAALHASAQPLVFARDGREVARIDPDALRETCGAQRVEVDDPYYARRKSFWACPLHAVLERGFGAPIATLRTESFLLVALDGYTRPAAGARLGESGGWIAFGDAELGEAAAPAWEPIDRRQVSPAPYYLVWSGDGQDDHHAYPWPYQLSRIEIARFETQFPRTVPTGVAPDSPAQAGYAVFRAQCAACHAINGQGGTIGPELNVPRSIVEYRDAAQLKAFIRNPQSFRYTSMPPNAQLSDAQLDALLAYFRAMSARKQDPNVTPAGASTRTE